MFTCSYYPASRVFFDLPRLVGKRKKTLPTASRIHIEHAPKSNVTKPRSASLSSCGEMTGKKIHCESEINLSIAAVCSKLVFGRRLGNSGEISTSIGSVGNWFSIDASSSATIDRADLVNQLFAMSGRKR